MAKNLDLRGKVTIDGADKAADQLEDIAQAADKVEEPIELTVQAKVDRALSSLDEVATDAKKAAEAAQALGRALGPELAAKADLGRMVAGFERAGLTLEEVTQEADQLGAKLREIAGEDGSGLDQIDGRARAAGKGMEEMNRSADSSKSVLANMIGNSAQDLGELGGIAGSVGVAFGQMGEYMADALAGGDKLGNVVKNFANVLGPIALLAVATQAVSGAMAISAARAEEAGRRVDELGDAMEGAADDSVGLAKSLRESVDALADFDATSLLGGSDSIINRMNDIAKSIPIIGGLAQDLNVDIPAAFDRAGTSVYAFSKAITGTTQEAQAFLDVMFAQMQAGKITGDEYRAITQAVVEYRKAQRDAAADAKLFNVNAEEANAILSELATKADPLSKLSDVWAVLFQDMADGSIDTQAAADAVNRLAAELGLTQEEVINLAQEHMDEQFDKATEAAQATADAMSEVQDQFAGTAERVAALGRTFDTFNAATPLAFAEQAADTVQSFDDLKDALKAVQDIGSKPLAPTAVEDLRGLSDESAAVIDAMGGMRDAIQTELGSALESAGGNFDSFRDKAAFFRGEITTQFTEAFRQMGLGPDEVDEKVTELLGNLGLLPSQVETQIRLTQADEAMRKIELFGDALGNLPPEVQAKVAASIDANDPVAAWDAINAAVQAQGAVNVGTAADPSGFTAGMEDVTGGDYAAEVELGVDPKPATTGISDVEEEDYKATVALDANTIVATAIILALITQKRTAVIDTELRGAAGVALSLGLLAAPRTANINVTQTGADAVRRTLDELDRDRTVNVTIRQTVNSVDRWDRINGGG